MSKKQWIAENLEPGEKYAGLILEKNGAKDYHLILLLGQADDVNWAAAMAWAKTIGGELPTRREQSLLFANLKEQFEPRWYWARETRASDFDYAWFQHFDNGSQGLNHKGHKFRARAVRRIYIEAPQPQHPCGLSGSLGHGWAKRGDHVANQMIGNIRDRPTRCANR